MIFSADTFDGCFKKSIDPRRQKWPFHSSNFNNFINFTHSTHSTFQGLRAFHSLRYTSFASLHFIRFALLCFTSFTSLRSVRRCRTPLASLISFASLRATHFVSLHSFRFTSLISLTPPFQVSIVPFMKFLHCFCLTRSTETPRLELYLIWKRQIFFDDD